MIQITLTLKMTTAQVVETSVTVNNNSPIQDYVHPDDQTQPPFEMTPGFKPFTVLQHVTFNNVASVCTGLNFFIFAHDNWLPSLAGMCKLLKTFLLQNEALRSLTGNNHTLNPKQNLLLTRTVITLQFSEKARFWCYVMRTARFLCVHSAFAGWQRLFEQRLR